jgi:hypothetical protein
MGTVTTTCSNGVSFGKVYTVLAADASNGYVIFDFTAPYDMAFVFIVLRSGAIIATTGALITRPSEGQVKIANGGSFTVTAGDIIHMIAQRDN